MKKTALVLLVLLAGCSKEFWAELEADLERSRKPQKVGDVGCCHEVWKVVNPSTGASQLITIEKKAEAYR